MSELSNQIHTEAIRAAKLAQEAVEAVKTKNFALSRTLIKDAVAAGKQCQILIEENKNRLKSF